MVDVENVDKRFECLQDLVRVAHIAPAWYALAVELAEDVVEVVAHLGTPKSRHWSRFPSKDGKNREPLCACRFRTVPGTINRALSR